jgi:two-component system response regulator YesN
MLKVLIVDDEPWSRAVIKSLGAWDRYDMEVIAEAEDGIEALELMQSFNPEVVITDMRMPGLEGVELLDAMRSGFPEASIIVMSGYDDFVYLKQAIRSKVIEYMLKPIRAEELNAALSLCVEEWQRRRAAASPVLFMDEKLLTHYMAYRQRIYDHLVSLNKKALLEELDKMGRELESAVPEQQFGVMAERVSRDLLLMAEETTNSTNEIAGLELPAATAWSTREELVNGLGDVYGQVIGAIMEYQKNRIKLDIGEVEAYLANHFLETLSLEKLAAHFLVTKEHLSRAFKAAAGETITERMIRLRMEKAKGLIKDQQATIKDAAELCGYKDLAYFYRVFKNHFGITPGELRGEEK